MEKWSDGQEDAKIVKSKGTHGSKQLAGISPETNETAQHISNAGGAWRREGGQLLLLREEHWLRKSTVQQNQVFHNADWINNTHDESTAWS